MTRPAVHAAVGPATAADAEAISALIVATLRASNASDDPPDVIERVATGLDPEAVRGMIGRRRVLVARDGGRVVGTAALEGDAVRSVFVLPEAQGRGIGTALMAELARGASTSGWDTGLSAKPRSARRGRSTWSAASALPRRRPARCETLALWRNNGATRGWPTPTPSGGQPGPSPTSGT